MAQARVEVPMAGKILNIKVTSGASVKEGEVICLLESMKMENPILSPVTGKVKEIKVSPGQFLHSGESVAIIEF